MTDELKQYIKDNLHLIDEEQYEQLYENLSSSSRSNLTQFLLTCNIKPDEHMCYIPDFYLIHSDINSYMVSPTVIRIGKSAFEYCKSLEHVVVPEGVTTIETAAFSECINLTDIVLPKTIKSFGNFAFSGCKNLRNIKFGGTITEWKSIKGFNSFGGTPAMTQVVCIDGITSTSCFTPF